jgi:hypothetical protein
MPVLAGCHFLIAWQPEKVIALSKVLPGAMECARSACSTMLASVQESTAA